MKKKEFEKMGNNNTLQNSVIYIGFESYIF